MLLSMYGKLTVYISDSFYRVVGVMAEWAHCQSITSMEGSPCRSYSMNTNLQSSDQHGARSNDIYDVVSSLREG